MNEHFVRLKINNAVFEGRTLFDAMAKHGFPLGIFTYTVEEICPLTGDWVRSQSCIEPGEHTGLSNAWYSGQAVLKCPHRGY